MDFFKAVSSSSRSLVQGHAEAWVLCGPESMTDILGLVSLSALLNLGQADSLTP